MNYGSVPKKTSPNRYICVACILLSILRLLAHLMVVQPGTLRVQGCESTHKSLEDFEGEVVRFEATEDNGGGV